MSERPSIEGLDEARLRELAEALEVVPVALIATDATGEVTHWSSHAEALYGWPRDEVLGRPIMALTVGPTNAAVAESVMAQVVRGRRWEGEFSARRRDGSEIDVHVIDLPVLRDGELVGIVGLSVDVTRERDLLEAEASVEATISHAELRSRRRERARLARELHDDLGQHLTMLRTELLGAIESGRLPDGDGTGRLLALTDGGLDRLHRIILDLAPEELRSGGLGAALEEQLRELGDRTGVRTRIEADYRPLDGAHARGIYRIVQGLLTNCERHARASTIEVRLFDEGDDLRLEVQDDGTGIPDDADGFGLTSIRTRVEELSGVFAIGREPEGGTLATAVFHRPPRLDGPE